MVLCDASALSSWSDSFLNKVTILCPNNSSLHLLVCRVASSMNLDSVITSFGILFFMVFPFFFLYGTSNNLPRKEVSVAESWARRVRQPWLQILGLQLWSVKSLLLILYSLPVSEWESVALWACGFAAHPARVSRVHGIWESGPAEGLRVWCVWFTCPPSPWEEDSGSLLPEGCKWSWAKAILQPGDNPSRLSS